jgi:glyoxylase-like metal-dependent hydrolase (beta-lactamase superfamily II)
MTMTGQLHYDVIVTDAREMPGKPIPNGEPQQFSPTSATLIRGRSEAVLVDGLLTQSDGERLVDWIAGLDTTLTTIYVTHGHGDHFFGLAPVLERFPDARVLATADVAKEMLDQKTPATFGQMWTPFADQLPGTIPDADVLDGDVIDLEGHELRIVRAGQSDTEHSTFVHVPDLDLVVAGDIVYNEVHPFVVATSVNKRAGWRRSLDLIAELAPSTVVAGHKRAGAPNTPASIAATREYLELFDEVLARGGSAVEVFNEMLSHHGDRINPSAIWAGSVFQTKLRDR